MTFSIDQHTAVLLSGTSLALCFTLRYYAGIVLHST